MAKIETGKGFEISLPTSYKEMQVEAEETITEIVSKYPKASQMWELLRNDPEVNADWDIANYIAVNRMQFNDHGDVHVKIVAASALKMLKLLLEGGVTPGAIKDRAADEDDVHLIVMTGALLHDIGIQVHREDHNLHSVYLAIPLLNRLLPKIYDEPEIMYEIRGHILHCIYAHRFEVKDLTDEAALVGIADGTDMTKGRGRMAFDRGNLSIHVISALAIEKVNITKGVHAPIRIIVEMSNSAGVFQVEETLADKITGGPLQDYIEVVAEAKPDEPNTDNRIIHQLIIRNGKMKAMSD